MKKIILLFTVLFVSKSFAQSGWILGTNKLYTNPTTSVGIGVTSPIVEFDLNGNLNLSKSQLIKRKLSFGSATDHIGMFYVPATSTSTYPSTFVFRGENGEGPVANPFPGDEVPYADGGPDLTCTDGMLGTQFSFNGFITSKYNNNSTASILMRHDGTNAIIEAQGTGLGGAAMPGDLYLNPRCNRNVFVLKPGGATFYDPAPFMSVAGKLNVAKNMQIGSGNLSSFLQPQAQLYVNASPLSTGIQVRHADNSTSGAGIQVIEQFDNDWGIAINRWTGANTFSQRFSVQGDGKMVINTTNSDAILLADANNSGTVYTRIKTNGQTFIGDKLSTNNGAMLTLGQPNKNVPALTLTDNTTISNKDFFSVYGNGYTEIKVYAPNAMPSSRVMSIIDMSLTTPKDLFVVKNNGKVYAREVEVNITNPFPDYVFSKKYDLITIPEMETFVQKNGHLPGFEKSEFYEKNGINIGSIIIKQQEKIEEQMLYIIQLEKRLSILEKRK
jgi:hypothetical protein